MANFRFLLSLIPFTATATSQDSNFPATNVAQYGSLKKCWKATVQNAIVDVTLDVGAGNTVNGLAPDPGLFIDDCNLSTVRIQANSVTSNWVTPPWDQTVSINRDDWLRRRKGFFRLADLSATPVAYRYLNVRITAQAGTDSENYRIARIALGPTTEVLSNPLYGIQRKRLFPKISTPLMDGGEQITELGVARAEITVEQQVFGAAELSQELDIEALTPGQPLVMWDADLGGSQHAWLMRRVDDPELTTPSLEEYRGRWTFREVT